MKEPKPINPNQKSIRGVLRLIGPLILGLGIIFMLVGVVDFFSSFARGGGMPTKFWCAFIGLPLLAVGAGITNFAFMGAVARYTAGEYAPVAKDTVNYMADGTSDAIKTVASAVREGFAEADGTSTTSVRIRCPGCGMENDVEARFCDQCGEALQKSKACPECGEPNDSDARFCDNCGKAIG